MIKLPFNEAMIASAREKAMSLGSINNSILKGGGNIAGYLGEEALAPYVGAKIVSNNRGLDKYNHDTADYDNDDDDHDDDNDDSDDGD